MREYKILIQREVIALSLSWRGGENMTCWETRLVAEVKARNKLYGSSIKKDGKR